MHGKNANYAVSGIPGPSGPSKGGFLFTAYPDRLASAICRDYLTLCHRFADAFERDRLQGCTIDDAWRQHHVFERASGF